MLQGKDTEGKQTVFFTAVDPMSDSHEEEHRDVSKPRKVQYKTQWKVFQEAAIFWMNLRNAQDKGLEFWKTRSNAIICMTLCQPTVLKKVEKYQNKNDKVSLPILNYSEGYLAGSTRRFSSALYQYGETRGGRGKEGA